MGLTGIIFIERIFDYPKPDPMNEMMLVVLAYLLGSIPTSIWVSKTVFGIDIRHYGSGNPGATNTFRVLGSKWGAFVMTVDISKGLIATSLYVLMPFYLHNELARTNFMILLGMAAVIGHIFPIWADFKGGKGVATILGMALAIQPLVALICILVFLITLFSTRFVSLSSMMAGVVFMVLILFIFREKETSYRLFAIIVAIMVVATHQRNIGRLLHGKENKAQLFKKNRKKQE
ncbi:MAG: glycerol-3-phosphate 1-O-acyltransferase PlsY [Chitinophagia bacterium]